MLVLSGFASADNRIAFATGAVATISLLTKGRFSCFEPKGLSELPAD